jgi:Ca2+-binding RTX toxin-like protein
MATYDAATKTFTITATDSIFFTLLESIPGANVIGDGRDNILNGNSSANRMEGGSGEDSLDGYAGADTLVGGLGRDFYTVDNLLDVVVEDLNSGEKDYVRASVSYVLSANVEDLRLKEGAGNISGTGNNLNNDLFGNEGDNRLEGLDGGDFLDGGLGADVMIGGSGNDRYQVDNAGDQVIETVEAGRSHDTVYTTIDYTLPSEVEGLMADAVQSLRLTGNGLNNAIFSSNGKDVLQGMAGKDTIGGGDGSDTLHGGLGKDVFVFDTKLNKSKNLDRVMDYKVADDTIWLDNAIFRKLVRTGTLSKSSFVEGSKAKDSDDFIGYDKSTGYLWYDANGSASGSQAYFAKLKAGLHMSASEFKIA